MFYYEALDFCHGDSRAIATNAIKIYNNVDDKQYHVDLYRTESITDSFSDYSTSAALGKRGRRAFKRTRHAAMLPGKDPEQIQWRGERRGKVGRGGACRESEGELLRSSYKL